MRRATRRVTTTRCTDVVGETKSASLPSFCCSDFPTRGWWEGSGGSTLRRNCMQAQPRTCGARSPTGPSLSLTSVLGLPNSQSDRLAHCSLPPHSLLCLSFTTVHENRFSPASPRATSLSRRVKPISQPRPRHRSALAAPHDPSLAILHPCFPTSPCSLSH